MQVSKQVCIAALMLSVAFNSAAATADSQSYDYNAPAAARNPFPATGVQAAEAEASLPSVKQPAVVRITEQATRITPAAEKPKAAPENILRSSAQEPARLEPNMQAAATRQIGTATASAPRKANWPAQPAQTFSTPARTLPSVSTTTSNTELRNPIAKPAVVASSDAVQPQRSPRPAVQQVSAYAEYNQPAPATPMNSTSSVMQPEAIAPGSPMAQGSVGQGFIAQGYNGYECNSCDSCSSSCYEDCRNCFNLCGCCGPFGGVEYLLLRPTFSENQAYLARTIVISDDDRVTISDNVVHNDYGYQSSVRAFFGYRFGCNEEIRFTYWNYGGSSLVESGRASQNGLDLSAGQLELVTRPGERLVVDNSLNMNVYDIEYSKCCCNPCNDCECCPPWSLKYSAGVRIADVRRQNNTFKLNENDAAVQAAFISADFIGAGPRVGLEGRRFFGAGFTSIFAKTNFSLLLGEYDIAETRKSPPSVPALTENFFDSHARIIPVAEIELGGSLQLSESMTLSAGYLFQAWWDLGAFEQIEGNVFLSTIDDSNIMSFDGLFARLEICF